MKNEIKKAVIISGGYGTRLNPLTSAISKQVLPVFDKPMIYYPLAILLLLKIKNILIVTDPNNINNFKKIFGNGSRFGIKINYKIQNKPKGIAHALKISKDFINNDKICVILGDNIFYGQSLIENIWDGLKNFSGACIFGYYMKDPNSYGVIKFKKKQIVDIVEKPKKKISNYAIPGLYFFDENLIKELDKIRPSKRGEYEITDVLKIYKNKKKLNYKIFGRGLAWLDTGTPDGLLLASNFIKTIEDRQGIKVACLEEIVFNNKWINKPQLKKIIKENTKSSYYKYLKTLL
jgi:glucose-1-phosphate thymidylyltransferase